MTITKKDTRRFLFFILLNALIGNTIASIIDYSFWFSLTDVLNNTLYSIVIGTLLWKGNELLYNYISTKFPWLKKPIKTLLIGFTSTSVYSIFIILLVNYVWYIVIYKYSNEVFWRQSIGISIYFIIPSIIIISIISHAIVFFANWKKSVINEEKLKSERLALQFEALKSQINPHFLFNSLNVLTSLVYKDPEKASKFIDQLAEVYKYVLDQKNKELVSLNAEIEFVEKYIYLQKIRFDQSLQVKVDIPSGEIGMIIPLSLQMLVENAIKHNVISEAKPLTISIYKEDEYIVVKNTLQRRPVIKESSKIGLLNIKARYEFLTNKVFVIEETKSDFIVKLPLL